MNIQEEIKSIEENLAKETERLNKLREQMNKPRTLREHFEGKEMVYYNYGLRKFRTQTGYSEEAYPTLNIAEKEQLRTRLIQWAYVLNGGEFVPEKGREHYTICFDTLSGIGRVNNYVKSYNLRFGEVFFKTHELAEEAMSKFTKEELIKMLS